VPLSKRPTPEDRVEAIRAALEGISAGTDPVELAGRLAYLHPERDTFPGEVFLGLAADALGVAGASRGEPVEYAGIRERYLPEIGFRGRTQHHRSHYALHAVAMIQAGLAPDLLDEVSWWDTNDLWVWSLYALIIYTRIAAERTGHSLSLVCTQIATLHSIDLAANRQADR
jgi:hypothetical protein